MAHRKARSALTAAGIVLGVAIVLGVGVTNATITSSIDRLSEDFTGRADVLVRPRGAFDATLPATVVRELEALDGVDAASGMLVVPASVSRDDRATRLRVVGVDLERERAVRDFVLTTGRSPAPGSAQLLVPEKAASRLHLRAGGRVTVTAAGGAADFEVAGLLAAKGAGRATGDDEAFAYTTLAAARALGARGVEVSRVSLVLEEGTDAPAWIDGHREVLGPALRLDDASAEAGQLREVSKLMGAFMSFFAAITLFVGAFLIYLTLTMAVVERTRVYGTLRALGATRGQVVRVVLAEAAALGAACAAGGVGLGLGLAKVLVALTGRVFEMQITGLAVRASTLATAAGVGVAVTLVSSIVPAVRAGRLAPVAAIRGEGLVSPRASRAWAAGAVLVPVGVALGFMGGSPAIWFLGTIVLLLGCVLLVPVVLRPLAFVLGRLTSRIAPGVGEIPVLHLAKERSRSGYTLALVMVVMAMLFSIGGTYASMRPALDRVSDQQFGADVRVDGDGALDPSVERELAGLRGVRASTPIRVAGVDILRRGAESTRMFAVVIDPASYFGVSGAPWVDGDDASAIEALTSGGAVLLPETAGKRRGDRVTMATTEGPRSFRVAGTVASFSTQPLAILGLGDGTRYFGVGRPFEVWLDLDDGAQAPAVKATIERTLGTRHFLDVQTAADVKAEARSELDQIFRIVWVVLAVAAIVGLLGLANTLAMSVVGRYREIGILRAIGVTRDQTWRMVLVEALTLGVAAFVLSVPLGSVLSLLSVEATRAAFAFTVPYRYPAGWIPGIAAFGVIVSALAALAPARRASRLEVVGALQYE